MLSQKNIISQLQDQCCNKAECAKEDLRDAAHHAGQKVREIYDSASGEMRDATAVVEKQIRKNPLAAGAIAAAAGFVLGAIFRRR